MTNAKATDEDTPFDTCAKLTPELFLAQIQLNKFAGQYLTSISGDQTFDKDGFLSAVRKYPFSDLTILPVPENPSQPPSGNNPVSQMCNNIVYFMRDEIGIPIDADAMYATVSNAFTNLKWATEQGFASFSSSSSGSNSAFEYRVMFSAPVDEETFISFVCTILLEADIRTEEEWWGLVCDLGDKAAGEERL
ncbi:hypothetical protein VNI00_009249 [Paramarasmius palmivorus]|uniref:Uncharacterized protein n=1 Tax=Paramarasmius palmivorus TaxID=297713 RepID=A0AAW0CUH7_9AGAR